MIWVLVSPSVFFCVLLTRFQPHWPLLSHSWELCWGYCSPCLKCTLYLANISSNLQVLTVISSRKLKRDTARKEGFFIVVLLSNGRNLNKSIQWWYLIDRKGQVDDRADKRWLTDNDALQTLPPCLRCGREKRKGRYHVDTTYIPY